MGKSWLKERNNLRDVTFFLLTRHLVECIETGIPQTPTSGLNLDTETRRTKQTEIKGEALCFITNVEISMQLEAATLNLSSHLTATDSPPPTLPK